MESLLADEFQANACAFSTAPALRHYFLTRPEIWEVRQSLQQGRITDDTVADFVATLLGSFTTGVHFEHDVTLAALAVVLEDRLTKWVEQFLQQLAELQIAEMPFAPRVATEVISRRRRMAENLLDPGSSEQPVV